MNNSFIIEFQLELSGIYIPEKLNNPFGSEVPIIAHIAAKEFKEFIKKDAPTWDYDFSVQKGKMFGVLVVQKSDGTYGYLGAVSGKTPKSATVNKFVPSIFDDSIHDYFINRGMSELTTLGNQIKISKNQKEVTSLKKIRKQKSFNLQRRLFENYKFFNLHGEIKNTIQIFENSPHGKPPSATGECAAPKLLQHAYKHTLRPIAIAEFWWGNSPKSEERKHQVFYPACKNKCRPILEYMLHDKSLYETAI